MPHIRYIDHTGVEHVVTAKVGRSVMQTAIDNAIAGIDGVCGGHCACATCHCYFDDAWLEKLPAMKALEDEMLEEVTAPRRKGSRLTCQIPVGDDLDGLVVHMPDCQ